MQRFGVLLLILSTSSRLSLMPHSLAIAGRCSTELVEQPSAMSMRRPFSKAFSVMMSSGFKSASSIFIRCSPLSLAKRMRSAMTAGIVPLPLRAMPRASVKQFMLFAVNIPEHEPQPGQALFSSLFKSASSIVPACTEPTASNTLERLLSLPWRSRPGSIGPPLTNMQGRLRRAAPISIPGTILSQFGTYATASKACPIIMVSTLSAISSREASEYFMPM